MTIHDCAHPRSQYFSLRPSSDRLAAGISNARTTIVARAEAGLAREDRLRWVWVALIGVLVVAAAAAWIWCRSKGYRGFSGHIEALRGPFGVKIGVRLGCY